MWRFRFILISNHILHSVYRSILKYRGMRCFPRDTYQTLSQVSVDKQIWRFCFDTALKVSRSVYCFTTSVSHGVENYFLRLWGAGISDAIFRIYINLKWGKIFLISLQLIKRKIFGCIRLWVMNAPSYFHLKLLKLRKALLFIVCTVCEIKITCSFSHHRYLFK